VIFPPCRSTAAAPLDVSVTDVRILDVQIKLRLGHMVIVNSDLVDEEWEPFDDMVHKVYVIGLGVLVIDHSCPDPHGVIDDCVLEATHP
jgi:hypothetical protein